MGFFDFLKKNTSSTWQPIAEQNERKLTYAEKELLAVQNTTLNEIRKLKGFPYIWNNPVQKFIDPHSHPFAYMDITGKNIKAAKMELAKMNQLIDNAKALCSRVPLTLCIPISDIVFQRRNGYGCTCLVCSPITYNGESSEYPIKLSFMTDMSQDNTTHGALLYGQDGCVHKAEIFFWRHKQGFFFFYDSVDGKLTLSRINVPDFLGGQATVYKGPHILAREATRIQEEKDFAWIQQHLPDKCPKSLSGYRRMKTQNTKNYQALQKLAAELGIEI